MIKKYLNILFYMFSFIFIYYLLVSGTNYEILPSLLATGVSKESQRRNYLYRHCNVYC